MTTTLKDIGLNKADPSKIPHYYMFPFKLWFRQHRQELDAVLAWCRANCTGADDESYYKIVCYTHRSSVRKPYSRRSEFISKTVYVDHIFLSNERDAVRIKLRFDVSDQKVKRPEKLPPKRRKKKTGRIRDAGRVKAEVTGKARKTRTKRKGGKR